MRLSLLLALSLACSTPPELDDTGTDEEDTGVVDSDGDGYDADTDCDDADASVYPGATETCDGADEDCDGEVDDDASDAPVWYRDADGDGAGGSQTTRACSAPSGFVAHGGDCDDADSTIHPGATEECGDGIDQDCSGSDEACPGPCDWNIPADTSSIQTALNSSSPGDAICVAAGTYVGDLSLPAWDVELIADDGAEATFLEGTGTGPVVQIRGSQTEATVMRGFTVSGGTTGEWWAGGGVLVEDASPTLTDLVFTGNADCALGLVRSSSTVERVQLTGNEGKRGGAINVYGEGAPVLRHVEATGNTGGYGGALWVSAGADVTLEYALFEGNTSNYGGGAYVDGSSIAVSNARVLGNDGAGIWLSTTVGELDHVVILGNDGRGLVVDGEATATVIHAIIGGNEENTVGGAMSITRSEASIEQAVIYRNMSQYGAAAYLNGGSIDLVNTVLADNGTGWTDVECVYEPCAATASGVALSSDGFSTDIWPDTGTFSATPGFLDGAESDPFAWDLHLDGSSELIDAGASGTDPDGSPADIGAFGGAGAGDWDLDGDGDPGWWQPGAYDSSYAAEGWDCDDTDQDVVASDC